MEILLNGVKIKTEEFELEETTDKSSTYAVNFTFEVIGEKDFMLFNSLLSHSTLNIEIPEKDIKFNSPTPNYSSSYTSGLNENTLIKFKVRAIEDVEKWNPNHATGLISVQNWARIIALVELLEERGIFNKDIFNQKEKEVLKRDLEKMLNYIKNGEDF